MKDGLTGVLIGVLACTAMAALALSVAWYADHADRKPKASEVQVREWTYCPFCGNEIKIEEND